MATDNDTHVARESSAPASVETVTVEAIAIELRTLLGLRTRTSARDRHLPHLTALLPRDSRDAPDARFAGITSLVESGIAAVNDADHATAAEALLGSGPGRWRPLSARGPEAAAPFGCGWDAYRRRRRSTGSSLLEETVDLLARTIIDLPQVQQGANTAITAAGAPVAAEDRGRSAVGDLPLTPSPTTTIDPPPLDQIAAVDLADREPGTARPVVVAATVTAMVLGTLGVAIWWFARSGDTSAASCGSLTHAVGTSARDADPERIALGEHFERFAAEADLGDLGTCASLVTDWEHGAIQQISAGSGSDVHALIGSLVDGEPAVLLLDPSELVTMTRPSNETGPDLGAPLGDTMGPVLGRGDAPDGVSVVVFDRGRLITEVHGAGFVIKGNWVDIWEETGGLAGGLGRPLSDRSVDGQTGGLFQVFERGSISTDASGAIKVIVDQDHFELSLPEDPSNLLVQARFAPHWWYIDAEGVRHLAQGDATYCAQRVMGARRLTNQDAAAVASLPIGEPLRCP